MSNEPLAIIPGSLMSMPVPKREVTILTLLEDALQRGDALDKIDRLLDVRDREERRLELKAFNRAIAAAKSQIEPIVKNRTVSFGAGKQTYKHADLAEIERALKKPLSENGLSYRFRSRVVDNQIIVTCMICHEDGHIEENSLPAPADTSGAKNAIQAIGSTTTYLSRYTLMLSLGLAASDDDDGAASGGKISEDQAIALQRCIEDGGLNLGRFCKRMLIDKLLDLPAHRLQEANNIVAAYSAGTGQKRVTE